MAWTVREHLKRLIARANQTLTDVCIIHHNENPDRAVISLEGKWQTHRIIVQEIYRPDGTIRYAYCVLNKDNQQIHRFDNSGDRLAIKFHYKAAWKSHQHEEIPHQHDTKGQVTLTPDPMTFEMFIEWLLDNL